VPVGVRQTDESGQHFGWDTATSLQPGQLAMKDGVFNESPVKLDTEIVGLPVGACLRVSPAGQAKRFPALGGVTPKGGAAGGAD